MPDLNVEHEDFILTYEWAIIEHLGLNLYSEVHSAISELIANAYDAEAPTVDVTLPIGVTLGLPTQRIIISDTGHGMTYEDCRDKFLRIGRNRRRSSNLSKNGKRRVIGKKGIGKLAGFGIADVITVRTIADGELVEFRLSLKDLRTAPERDGAERSMPDGETSAADVSREYHPQLLRYKEPTVEPSGTTVTLEQLRRLDPIDFDDFMQRLSRKFAVFGDDFKVTVHKARSKESRTIEKFEVACQFRFPDSGWAEENIETPTLGTQMVRYWVGFTQSTIKDDALRGISIVANGKSVQEPFDFRVTGGTTGQFGLQYMTGEVVADWLDDEEKVDVIASDRASVRWSDLDAHTLLLWGKEKVKTLLDEWVRRRAEATNKSIQVLAPEIYAQIDAYKGAAREELKRVVDRVVSTIAPLGEERKMDVVRSIVVAYSHEHIRAVLQRVLASSGGWDEWVEAISEWDIINAVLTFQELSVKLAAIQTLQILIEAGAPETKSVSGYMSLHEHLAAHPWLLDPMYREMDHELNIDNFCRTRYGGTSPKDSKRADFVVLYDSERVRVVEIKSAKAPIDLRGVTNLTTYHRRVKLGEAQKDQARGVRSVLVYNGEVTSDAVGTLDLIKSNRDEYEVYTWRELLDRNVMIYKEQLRRVREKAPDDPRVRPLWESLQDREGPARSSSERRRARSRRAEAASTKTKEQEKRRGKAANENKNEPKSRRGKTTRD